MIINHNIPAINAQRSVSQNTYKIGNTQEKLSSGQRLNRTADDAASISEITPNRTGGLKQAGRDAQDAVSLVQTEDGGALSNTGEITTINNSQVSSENIQSAEFRIRDADMAREMMDLTRLNILTHASTTVLAQSNTQPQNILRLLGQ